MRLGALQAVCRAPQLLLPPQVRLLPLLRQLPLPLLLRLRR